jgi:hypothetical protein
VGSFPREDPWPPRSIASPMPALTSRWSSRVEGASAELAWIVLGVGSGIPVLTYFIQPFGHVTPKTSFPTNFCPFPGSWCNDPTSGDTRLPGFLERDSVGRGFPLDRCRGRRGRRGHDDLHADLDLGGFD